MQFKYSTVAMMALSGLAAAQIPACATTCLANAISAAPSCSATDVACQCEPANKALIQAAATPCVEQSCTTAAEIQAVLAAAAALCSSAGSSSTVASSSASVASSSSTPASTTAAPTSSTPSTLTTTASSTKTECPCEETSATAASNGTTTPTIVPFTGSASSMAAGLGSVFAISFAVLAAFYYHSD